MTDTGLVQRERHSADGNGALVAVIDSAGPYWERSIVDETVLAALEHFGFPYRLLDLARERPAPEALNRCAGIVLAQNRLGERLSEAETGMIADAVQNGAGLVNLDYDLRLYSAPLHPERAAGRVLRGGRDARAEVRRALAGGVGPGPPPRRAVDRGV